MSKKITKKDVINAMLANEVVSSNEVWVSFLENELKLLSKKSTAETATQKANKLLEVEIVKALGIIGKGTVTDIQSASVTLKQLSNQKVSSIVRAMVEKGSVLKTVEKRKSIFSLPKQDEDVEESE